MQMIRNLELDRASDSITFEVQNDDLDWELYDWAEAWEGEYIRKIMRLLVAISEREYKPVFGPEGINLYVLATLYEDRYPKGTVLENEQMQELLDAYNDIWLKDGDYQVSVGEEKFLLSIDKPRKEASWTHSKEKASVYDYAEAWVYLNWMHRRLKQAEWQITEA